MRRIERQIAEPWALGLMTCDEINRCISEQVRRVSSGGMMLRDRRSRCSAIDVMFPVIDMSVVVDVARCVTEKFVKPALSGTRPFGETNVPFAKASCPIPGRLQDFGHQNLVVVQTNPVVTLQAR